MGNRPRHAGDAPHPVERGGRHGVNDVGGAADRVHDPQVGGADVVNGGRATVQQIDEDGQLLGDQQRLQDYMRRNPAEFVDFNIPWDISLDFSGQFASVQRPGTTEFGTEFFATTNLRSSFSLTPKWNFTTNGAFNFQSMKVELVSMSINRDMHCWQMSIGVQKGIYGSSFNISISPKSSLLQDLRVNRTRSFSDF